MIVNTLMFVVLLEYKIGRNAGSGSIQKMYSSKTLDSTNELIQTQHFSNCGICKIYIGDHFLKVINYILIFSITSFAVDAS